MNKLLLIDDDVELCELLEEYLGAEGFDLTVANDGQSGIDALASKTFDLVVLDIMMPVLNGFETLQKMRKFTQVPVLMLTARGEDVDRIVGLEMGADDYVAKPFNPRELVARIRAILRRVQGDDPNNLKDNILTLGDLSLNTSKREVKFSDTEIILTSTEFNLLSVLLSNAGEVVTKADLSEIGLGKKLMKFDRSLDMHISNIRRKLQESGVVHVLIKTIRGVGYQICHA